MSLTILMSLLLASSTLLVYGQAPIPGCATPATQALPFCNTSLSFEERVNNLISLLLPEEKPFLMEARQSPDSNISRLEIQNYDWGLNCIHGVQSMCGTHCATSFPSPNALGATFDRSIWLGMAQVIGIETRALWLEGVGEYRTTGLALPQIGLNCWSPNLEVVRDPRWGRNMETPSEDPLINGIYGTLYSIGLQNGSDPRYVQAIATLKHFDANSLEGTWGPYNNITRHNFNAIISTYDLASTYTTPFRTAVEVGEALGVMCSYNAINGVPSCANDLLLTQLLRDKWRFGGYVTSDSDAISDIYDEHHYLPNATETVGAAIRAGCNMESNLNAPHAYATGGLYISNMAQAIQEGFLNETDVDAALYNLLLMRFRLGLFDPIEDQPYWNVSPDVVQSDASRNLSLLASQESLVLLRNEDATLPFPKGVNLAVIGPHYEAQIALVGDYYGQLCMEGPLDFNCITTVFDALSATNNASGGTTTGALGCQVNSQSIAGFAEAIATAEAADYVVLMLGLNLTIEDEGLDRHNITLPGVQEQLAEEIIALGKPTVVVLINGGIIAIDWLSANAPAILESWYPGFYGAQAIASAVFGDYNPGGKLPVTIYNSQFTEQFDMLNFNMSLPPGRTYRYFTGTPLYPFGWGLSYTTFNLSLANSETVYLNISNSNSSTATVSVQNIGNVLGDEVIQAYFSTDSVPAAAPASVLLKELFDFERVSLAPSEATQLSFTFSADTFITYDAEGNQVIYPGNYMVTITNGVALTVQVPVVITGQLRIVDTFL